MASDSVWVIEVQSEIHGWHPIYHRNSEQSAIQCRRAILRNVPERDRQMMESQFRVREYVPKEDRDASR